MMTLTALGRVGQNVELKASDRGTEYVQFSIAAENPKDRETPEWIRCSAFNGTAQRIINAKVSKGSLIQVTGRMSMNRYTNREGIEMSSVDLIINDWSYVPTNNSPEAAAALAAAKQNAG